MIGSIHVPVIVLYRCIDVAIMMIDRCTLMTVWCVSVVVVSCVPCV
jgi:hypothetical protein